MVSEEIEAAISTRIFGSLNPCSGGLWFLSSPELPSQGDKSGVLILVLVDYGF